MCSVCSPVSTLIDYIELGHFDNVLFSVCSILQCMHQREIATCPFDAQLVGQRPSSCPGIFASHFSGCSLSCLREGVCVRACVRVFGSRALPSSITALATLGSSQTPRMLDAAAVEWRYSLNLSE